MNFETQVIQVLDGIYKQLVILNKNTERIAKALEGVEE